MRLHQLIAVDESDLRRHLLLLVAHSQHKAQGHRPGPEFFGIATMRQVGQVACVGVSQATALGVEEAIEASVVLPRAAGFPCFFAAAQASCNARPALRVTYYRLDLLETRPHHLVEVLRGQHVDVVAEGSDLRRFRHVLENLPEQLGDVESRLIERVRRNR